MLTLCYVLPSDKSANVNKASLVFGTLSTSTGIVYTPSHLTDSMQHRLAAGRGWGTGATPGACYEATFKLNVEGCTYVLSFNTVILGPPGNGKPEVREAT